MIVSLPSNKSIKGKNELTYTHISVAQSVKNPPTMQVNTCNAGDKVQSLDRRIQGKDLLQKEMATHSSILTWEIPWTEEPGGIQSMELQSQTRLSN